MRFGSRGAAVRRPYVTDMHYRKTLVKDQATKIRKPNQGYVHSLTVNTTTTTGLFSFLGSGFAQMFGQMVFIKLNAIKNTNLEALWQIKRGAHFRLTTSLKNVFA